MQRTLIYFEDKILAYCADKLSINDVISKDDELYLVYKIDTQLKSCDLVYVRKVQNDGAK